MSWRRDSRDEDVTRRSSTAPRTGRHAGAVGTKTQARISDDGRKPAPTALDMFIFHMRWNACDEVIRTARIPRYFWHLRGHDAYKAIRRQTP